MSEIVSKKKTSAGLRKWRRKQKPGAIMKPGTFKKGVEAAEARGLSKERAEKSMGAAYWKVAKAKYVKAKKRKKAK